MSTAERVLELCLERPRKVVWTEPRAGDAGDALERFVANNKKHLVKVRRTADFRCVEFANGSRIQFMFRNSNAFRGMSGVDVLVIRGGGVRTSEGYAKPNVYEQLALSPDAVVLVS